MAYASFLFDLIMEKSLEAEIMPGSWIGTRIVGFQTVRLPQQTAA